VAGGPHAAVVRALPVSPLPAEALDSLMPSPQQWLILIVLLAGLAAAYLRLRRRRPKDGAATSSRQAAPDDLRPAEQTRRDLEQLVDELRTLTGRLDAAIDEADQRIQALRTFIYEAKRLAAVPAGRPLDPRQASPDSPAAAEPQKPPAANPPPPTAGPPPPAPTAADHRRQRIYELADRGLSPVQIAAQVGQSTGEVELILNIRRSMSGGLEPRP